MGVQMLWLIINFLVINNEKEIANKLLEFAMLEEHEKKELKKLSYTISNYFSSNQESIIYQWILLFTQKNKLINEYLDKDIVRKTIFNKFIISIKRKVFFIIQINVWFYNFNIKKRNF